MDAPGSGMLRANLEGEGIPLAGADDSRIKAGHLRPAIVKLVILADKYGREELREAAMAGSSRGKLYLDRRRPPLRHI
ncbi:hypothetical protein ColLi_00436 [Colletotrichum liriopes]|uniref:Uncharacterized protein n=1 Tax=Colletotrichum liriopes TaxID=708192 RepID=A0AA37GB40_9PEZI|nr:hypothetical protein ColLi_00436 [Colletotrichum liriopes]